MRKNIVFLVSIFFAIHINAQQVNNSSFEKWDGDKLEGWTNHVQAQGYTLRTASKTSDAYAGQSAVDLKTFAIGGYIVPGAIQLGYLNAQLEPTGGMPFTYRPNALSIHLKYSPQNGDSLIIFAYLTKFNSQTNRADTIGGCFYAYNKPVASYTPFVVPIYYRSDEQPDTLNIFFSSSFIQRTPNSELIIDSLQLLYGNFLLPPQAYIPTQISDSGFTAQWKGADFTKGYYLDVATDADFSNHLPGFHDKYIGDTSKYYVPVNDRNIKQIYYRVKADYDSVVSDYSVAVNFDIPYAPVAYNPKIVSSKGFIVTWQNLPLANKYIFDLSEDSAFSSFVPGYYYFETNDTSCSLFGLEADKDYYYRVRAYYFGKIKSDFSNIVKVHTLHQFKTGEVSVSYNGTNASIYIDTLSFSGSRIMFFNTMGQIIWAGKLTDRFVNIPGLPEQIIFVVIQKPDGEIIRKKVSLLSY